MSKPIYLILLFFTSVFVSGFASAQPLQRQYKSQLNPSNYQCAQTIAQQKQHIRAVYAHINQNQPNLKVATYNIYQSTEGGKVTLYFDHNQLKKIKEINYSETGKSIFEYYFDDQGLVFIFKQDHNYNAPITQFEADDDIPAFDPNKSRIEENRYYFCQGKMIEWLDENKRPVPPNSKRYIDKQNELLNSEVLPKM